MRGIGKVMSSDVTPLVKPIVGDSDVEAVCGVGEGQVELFGVFR